MDLRRLYSALVFIPLLYVGIRYSPPWLFSLLIGLVAAFALWEFISMYFGQNGPLFPKVASCFLTIFLLIFWEHEAIRHLHVIGLLFASAILLGFFFRPTTILQALGNIHAYTFGLTYVGFFLGFYISLRNLEHGVALVFFVMIVTWLSDTGGFFIGKPFGKHRLASTLSPNKTIEGLIGGVAFSVIGATISHLTFTPFFSIGECVMLGVSLALLGALGDLAESAIKRSVHVKDSGTIIPGHGGVLDRIDSLLFTGPAMYYYVILAVPSS